MSNVIKTSYFFILIGVYNLCYPIILAKGNETPTFYLDVGTGITTYKSEALESNDTSITIGYALGIYAGQDKELGFALNNETNTTDFTYANSTLKSKMATTFQDTIMRYRLGPIYFGPTFNQTTIESTNQDVQYLDLMASGLGGNAGLLLELRKDSKFFIDVLFSTASVTKEAIQTINTVSIGSRTDLHMGGIIKISRSLLNMQIGYKHRTFGVTVSGTSYTETLSYTWIGLGMNTFL